MVKGNAARRKELAQNRRQDQKQEQSRLKLGPFTAKEARARLLSDARPNDELYAWCSDKDSAKAWCVKYLRLGQCESKRCRFEHSLSLAHLTDSTWIPDMESCPPLNRVLLRECDPGSGLVYNRTIRTKVRLDSPICFIEFNGAIVYDFHNPEIYNDYLKKNTSCQIAAEKPASSNAIQVEPSFSYSLASLLDEQLPTL